MINFIHNIQYRDLPNCNIQHKNAHEDGLLPSPKHVELLNVMNKINHQILCILLDRRYIKKLGLHWSTVVAEKMLLLW